MKEDDSLKIKATALYVVEKCGAINMYNLFKIMFFAESMHAAIYGRTITKESYVAMDYGPVPSHLYNLIKEENETSIFHKKRYTITSEHQCDMDELSPSDIEVLDHSISENKDLSFEALKEKSHRQAWKKAYDK